jgi:hypothetical protein
MRLKCFARCGASVRRFARTGEEEPEGVRRFARTGEESERGFGALGQIFLRLLRAPD